MRIAVTGVAGDVGGFVARELSAYGHDVVGVDVREAPRLPLERFHEASVEDRPALERAFAECDAIVHLAAIREPGVVVDEILFRVNVMGTFNALEAAVAVGAQRFVLASSEAVLGFSYGGRARSPERVPIDEEHALAPEDSYALSKLIGEELCRGYARRGALTTLCLRTCYVWSLAWRDDAIDSIEDTDRAQRGLWAYVDARDAARAYRLACEASGIEHATLFISASDSRSRTPTVDLLREVHPTIEVRGSLSEFGAIGEFCACVQGDRVQRDSQLAR